MNGDNSLRQQIRRLEGELERKKAEKARKRREAKKLEKEEGLKLQAEQEVKDETLAVDEGAESHFDKKS